MKLVTTALEWSYAAGETDVRAETLEAAAELLTLRRDAIRVIDGAGPAGERRLPEQEQGNTVGAEPGVESGSPRPLKDQRKKTEAQIVEDGEARAKAPRNVESETSSGLVDTPDAVSPTKPKRTRRVGEPKPKWYAVDEPETSHTT